MLRPYRRAFPIKPPFSQRRDSGGFSVYPCLFLRYTEFMEATFKLNTRELTPGFIESLKTAYPEQNIEITVRQAEEDCSDAMDADAYLRSNPVMGKILDARIADVNCGRNLISFDTMEDLKRCVDAVTEKERIAPFETGEEKIRCAKETAARFRQEYAEKERARQ